MNSSPHIDNKGKDILLLGTGPTQGLGEHSLTAEKMYSINFTKNNTKFCLSLHYNEANTSFIGYIYDFSVGYDAISVDDIKDIYKYLMKKNSMV